MMRARGTLSRGVLVHGALAGALCVTALVTTTPALALFDDRLTLFVDETVTWDNNVFRIPKGQNPDAFGGPRDDTYDKTSAGLSFDVPVSRQRFQGGYTWFDTRYDHYSNLDFTGHDAKLLWLWQIGNDASGQLGYTDLAAPQTFASVQGRANTLLRTEQFFGNAKWLLTPSWRLDAGARGYKQTNRNDQSRFNDIDIATGEASMNYVSPANNSLGLHASWEDGHYPNRQFVPGGPLPHAYSEYDTGAVFNWTLSGASKLSGRLEYANRRWDDFPQMDWDGFVGRVQYDWQPTGKLTITGILRREINPYDDSKAQFTLIKSASVIPVWNATAKIDVTGVLDYSIRDYLGMPQGACGLTLGSSDRVTSGTVTVAWHVLRNVTLSLSGQHQRCTSDSDNANYTANIGTLGIRLGI